MKKAVSLLVALALFATTAFAAPLSVATFLPEPPQTVTSSASTDIDALFADVNAVALTEEEALAVEGEGIFGAIIGAICGATVGLGYGLVVGIIAGDVASGVIGGTTGGATVGATIGGIGTAF